MGEAQAQKVVLGTFVVVLAVVAWDSIKRTGKALPPFKSVVALTILAAGLALLSGVAPGIAGPLAILIGLAVVISRISPGGARKNG